MAFPSIPDNYKTAGKYTLAFVTPFVILFVFVLILYFYKNSQNKKKGLKPIGFNDYFKKETKKEYAALKKIFKRGEKTEKKEGAPEPQEPKEKTADADLDNK